MDFIAVREALRRSREAARLTLDQAADSSGLNRATIHSIENVRREPDLKPELDTIERLAITYGLKLSALFRQIEQLTAGDGSTTISPASPPGTPHGADRPLHDDLALRLGELFTRAAGASQRQITRSILTDLAYAVLHGGRPIGAGKQPAEIGERAAGGSGDHRGAG